MFFVNGRCAVLKTDTACDVSNQAFSLAANLLLVRRAGKFAHVQASAFERRCWKENYASADSLTLVPKRSNCLVRLHIKSPNIVFTVIVSIVRSFPSPPNTMKESDEGFGKELVICSSKVMSSSIQVSMSTEVAKMNTLSACHSKKIRLTESGTRHPNTRLPHLLTNEAFIMSK